MLRMRRVPIPRVLPFALLFGLALAGCRRHNHRDEAAYVSPACSGCDPPELDFNLDLDQASALDPAESDPIRAFDLSSGR